MSSSEPCVAKTQLELSVADEFFVDILKLEENLEKMSDEAFTPSQSIKLRTALLKFQEKLRGADTPVAAQVDTRVATAKAVSCIAAATQQMSNAQMVLLEETLPQTPSALQTRTELQRPQVATAKAISYMAAAIQQMSNAQMVLLEETLPQTSNALQSLAAAIQQMSNVQLALLEEALPQISNALQTKAEIQRSQVATAKTMSCIAAAIQQMSKVQMALLEETVPQTSNTLQTKTELQRPQAGHHITGREIEELTKALRKASVVPDTRLVIAYPCDSEQYFYQSGDPVLPLREKLHGKALYGVVQCPEHADYTLTLPGHERSTIQIIYNPESNDCHLIWMNAKSGEGPDAISIINLDIGRTKGAKQYIVKHTASCIFPKQFVLIKPGFWRILITTTGKEHPSTIDILLLQRPFNITIANGNSDDIDDRSLKRRKRSHTEETTIADMPDTAIPDTAIPGADIPGTSMPDTGILETADNNMTRAFSTFPDSQIEQIAVIKSKTERNEYRYFLQTTKECKILGKNRRTRVFSCQHSRIPEKLIAAKVLGHKETSTARAQLWKQEVVILKNLSHANIVKLVGYDARIFAIYLRICPQTLDNKTHELFNSRVQLPHILKILQHMSSALAYLATQGIVHNDVKPGNISYSYRRGAVLLDFGIASYSSTSTKDEGGTPWYIPPEYLINRSRGFAGDIWALGVTSLYLLRAIPLPDKYAGDWNIVNAFKQHGPDRGHMEIWIGKIESIRQNLCQVEEWNGVKALVAKMLDNKPQERVTAAGLETLAMNLK